MTGQRILKSRVPSITKLSVATAAAVQEEASLTGVVMREVDATGTNAEHLVLRQSVLVSTSLAGANLDQLVVEDVRLDECDFSNAAASRSRWTRVEVTGCKLTGARLYGARFAHTRFTDCRMDFARMQLIVSQHLEFDRCTMRGAYFQESDLQDVRFRGCDLREADLRGAQLARADLRGSNLESILITIEQLRGIVVTSDQALYLCGLVGMKIDDEAPLLM